MSKMLCCYRFYTAKNQRISAFGKENNGKLEIFLEKCCKKDSFYKSTGRTIGSYWFKNGIEKFKVLYGDLYKPEVVEIEINKGNTAQFEFIQYLNENFYKKTTRKKLFTQEILFNGIEVVPLRTLKHNYKL